MSIKTGKSTYGDWVNWNGLFMVNHFAELFVGLSKGEQEYVDKLFTKGGLVRLHEDDERQGYKNKLDKLTGMGFLNSITVESYTVYAANHLVFKAPNSYKRKST